MRRAFNDDDVMYACRFEYACEFESARLNCNGISIGIQRRIDE